MQNTQTEFVYDFNKEYTLKGHDVIGYRKTIHNPKYPHIVTFIDSQDSNEWTIQYADGALIKLMKEKVDPRSELKVDDKIEVSNNKVYWGKAHFASFSPDETGVKCFAHCKSSFTSFHNEVQTFKYWKKVQ